MPFMMISICYSWMMHGKRKELPCCVKIGIAMPLLTFKFNAQIQGSFLFSINFQGFISKSEILFELLLITKKGKIENASRPLMDFGD
jgi:hypothetical protein